MNLGSEQTERGLAAMVGRVADGFSRLVSQHLTLARLELAEDVKAAGADVARIAVFVPFVLVGYLFVCGALAGVLATWTGWAGALGLVGGVNLVAGGVGVARAARRLSAFKPLGGTAAELERSAALAVSAATGARNAAVAATGTNPLAPGASVAPAPVITRI